VKERALPTLVRVETPIRPINERLWALLTKPGKLTPEEWAYVEECERNG